MEQTVRVAWSAPVDTGGRPILGYTIYYRAGTSGPFTSVPVPGTGIAFIDIGGLLASQLYQVYVTAYNIVGEGSPTTTQSATTIWDPSLLPGLVGWWDAEHLPSITKDGSDVVTSWACRKNPGNVLTQGAAGNRPTWSATGLGSRPAMVFNGSSSFLGITNVPSQIPTGSNAGDVFAVSQYNGVPTANVGSVMTDYGGGTSRRLMFRSLGGGGFSVVSGNAQPLGTYSATGNFINRCITYMSTTAVNFTVGLIEQTGTETTTTSINSSVSTGIVTFRVGSNSGGGSIYNGTMNTIIFTDTVLTGTDRTNLITYLKYRGAIS